jgi:hypothetical protein
VPFINPNFGETYSTIRKAWPLAWTHIVTPRILNEFRYGFLDIQTQDYNKRSQATDFDQNSWGIGTFMVNHRPTAALLPGSRIPPIGGLGAPSGIHLRVGHRFVDGVRSLRPCLDRPQHACPEDRAVSFTAAR